MEVKNGTSFQQCAGRYLWDFNIRLTAKIWAKTHHWRWNLLKKLPILYVCVLFFYRKMHYLPKFVLNKSFASQEKLKKRTSSIVVIICRNHLPVLSWSFTLDVGLTGWTGWLKISVDFAPWLGTLFLVEPAAFLVTAPKPRRRPLPERSRLPPPSACVAALPCNASSAELPFRLLDLPT